NNRSSRKGATKGANRVQSGQKKARVRGPARPSGCSAPAIVLPAKLERPFVNPGKVPDHAGDGLEVVNEPPLVDGSVLTKGLKNLRIAFRSGRQIEFGPMTFAKVELQQVGVGIDGCIRVAEFLGPRIKFSLGQRPRELLDLAGR